MFDSTIKPSWSISPLRIEACHLSFVIYTKGRSYWYHGVVSILNSAIHCTLYNFEIFLNKLFISVSHMEVDRKDFLGRVRYKAIWKEGSLLFHHFSIPHQVGKHIQTDIHIYNPDALFWVLKKELKKVLKKDYLLDSLKKVVFWVHFLSTFSPLFVHKTL